MKSTDPPSRPEREQTDESLRLEREKADSALGEKLAALQETADAVIERARLRADRVLARARANTDRLARTHTQSPVVPELVEEERRVQDAVVEAERTTADETLSAERAAEVGYLTAERHETDSDLLAERAVADSAVATRDDFLGIVSHDLRNMLGSIIGFAGLIANGAPGADEAQVRAFAQRIQRSGTRMNRLIGDLVDLASIEAGRLTVAPEPSDPAQIVTEVVEGFQAQALASGIALTADLASPVPAWPLDPARILQVLGNLVGNAVKFTRRNGRVVVAAERVGDAVRFSVRDTGIGIPAAKVDAIFERFLQVQSDDRRGVGLGLYISRCIVRGHGGRIWVESRIGAGSTFFFTIPARVDTPADRPSATSLP